MKKLKFYLMCLSVGLGLLLSCLMIMNVSYKVNELMNQQRIEKHESIMRQSVSAIKNDLENMQNILNTTASYTTLQFNLEKLIKDEMILSAVEKYNLFTEITQTLRLLKVQNHFIEDIMVVSPAGQFSAMNNSISYHLNTASLIQSFDMSQLYTLDSFSSKLFFSDMKKSLRDYDNLEILKQQSFFATNMFNQENQIMGMVFVVINIEEVMNQLLIPEKYCLLQGNEIIYQGSQFNMEDDEILLSDISPFNITLQFNRPVSHEISIINYPIVLFVTFMSFAIVIILTSKIAVGMLKPFHMLLVWIEETVAYNQKFSPITIPDFYGKTRLTFRERLFSYLIITTLVPVFTVSVMYYGQISQGVLASIQQEVLEEIQGKAMLIDKELEYLKKLLAALSTTHSTDNALKILQSQDSHLIVDAIQLNILEKNSAGLMIDYDQLRYIRSIEKMAYSTVSQLTHFVPQSEYRIGLIDSEFEEEILTIALPFNSKISENTNEGFYVLSIDHTFFNQLPYLEVLISERISDNEQLEWIIFNKSSPTHVGQFSYELPSVDLVYSGTYTIDSVYTQIIQMFWSSSVSLLWGVLVLFFIAYYCSEYFVKLFYQIIEDPISSAKKPLLKWLQIDEIELLRQQFISQLLQLEKVINEKITVETKAVQIEYEKREIQLFAIQNQVNPHFLYNTLENLLFLVEDVQTERAVNMIESVTYFFQFITNRTTTWVTLEEEIQFSKVYSNMMKIRFDNFSVSWQVQDVPMNIPILKLILQPLIENAIHHGVRHTDNFVHIVIKIQKSLDNVILIVADDAIGIDVKQLDIIRDKLQQSHYNQSGIYNVNDRLKLFYKNRASLTIESKKGKGTIVTITIPLHLLK